MYSNYIVNSKWRRRENTYFQRDNRWYICWFYFCHAVHYTWWFLCFCVFAVIILNCDYPICNCKVDLPWLQYLIRSPLLYNHFSRKVQNTENELLTINNTQLQRENKTKSQSHYERWYWPHSKIPTSWQFNSQMISSNF